MMEFSAIDDSLVYKKGIFVYSHAIVSMEHSKTITFVGNNKEIYQNEEKLLEFIAENTTGNLYACRHYRQYTQIWNKVVCTTSDKSLPKIIRKAAIEAHHFAKNEAKNKLKEIIYS